MTVIHLDLYRLGSPDELEGLGLRELLEPGYVWLVEWPERGAGHLPPADLKIELELDGAGRKARLIAGSGPGSSLLAALV